MKKSILFAVMTLLTSSVFAGELEDILKKHYEAMGGTEAMDSVKSLVMKTNMSMQTPQGPMEMPMEITVKDKKVRSDVSFQGMKITQAYDGENGWQIMPMMGEAGAQDMSDDDVKGFQRMSQMFSGLYQYEERGDKLELVGKADVEGAEAYELKMTDADGEVSYIYLDTEYFLVVKTKATTTQMGAEMEAESFVSDYKNVGDLLLPHSVNVKMTSGMEMTMSVESFELNVDGDDSIFEKPAAPAAPAEDQ